MADQTPDLMAALRSSLEEARASRRSGPTPDPAAQNPPADWSWQTHPDVVWWDWRQGPDLGELAEVLGRHGVTLTEVETGTDDVAVRIGSTPVEVMEDALCRRVWAAALRYAGDHERERQFPLNCVALGKLADRIEAGTLTPWAETAPVDPPSVAVEPPAAPGTGTDTPEAAESESRPSLADAVADQFRAVWNDRDFRGNPAPVLTPSSYAEARAAGPSPEAHIGAEGLILGRAWMDPRGGIYDHNVDDETLQWLSHPPTGPVREVLLVPVEAGPVLEAALRWTRAWDADPFSPQTAAAKAALAAAVDAATSRQPTAATMGPRRPAGSEPCREDLSHRRGAESVPESEFATGGIVKGGPIRLDTGCVLPGVPFPVRVDSSVPQGWDRCGVDHLIAMMDGHARTESGEMPVTVDDAAQLRALLAERDELAANGSWNETTVDQYRHALNAARAELAEATNLVEDAYRSMTEAEWQRDVARTEAAQLRGELNEMTNARDEVRTLLAEATAAEVPQANWEARADGLGAAYESSKRHDWLGWVCYDRGKARASLQSANKLLAEVTAERDRAQRETDGVRDELTRMAGDLADREAERDQLRALLAERGRLEEIGEGLRQQIRRDGAADTLEWLRTLDDSRDKDEDLERMAAEVRAGELEIPARQDGDAS